MVLSPLHITLLVVLFASAATYAATQEQDKQPPQQLPPLPPVPAQLSPLDVAKQQFSLLTPEQIEELGAYIDRIKFSTDKATPGPVAKPITSSQIANLSPGAPPVLVRLSRHYGAALVFTDLSGNPWAIKGQTNFSKGLFEVSIPVEGGNILTIKPQSTYGTGNAIVVLDGLSTPLSIGMATGQGEVDYRMDIKVPGVNPAKVPPVAIGTPAPGVPVGLSPYLDGVPPSSSKALKVKGVSTLRAWKTGDGDYIVVSRDSVLSPAYMDGLGAADGTRAYRLPATPVVLVSVNGVPVNVEISED